MNYDSISIEAELDLVAEDLLQNELALEELPDANAYGTFACLGCAACACGCASSAGSISSAS